MLIDNKYAIFYSLIRIDKINKINKIVEEDKYLK